MYGRRGIGRYFSLALLFFGTTQYLTYELFSWDIVEPLTCLQGLAHSVIGYLFWVFTKRNMSKNGIYSVSYDRRKRKASRREGYDEVQLRKIKGAIAAILRQLSFLD